MILQILDKSKNRIGAYSDYQNLRIEKLLDMDDKTLSFQAFYSDIQGIITCEGYIETREDRFVVKEVSPGTDGMADVICKSDTETLEGKTFRVFETVQHTAREAAQLIFAGTGWTVGICEITKERTLRKEYCTSWELLKQLASTYRCELVFHTKTQVMDILNQRGGDKGTYFTSDLNLKRLDVSNTSYEFFTEILPYGKDGMTIESVNDGVAYVSDYTYSDKKKRMLWKDERYTVPEHLKEDAVAKLQDYSRPYISYVGEIEDLAKSSSRWSALEYEIGDTVTIIDAVTGTRDRQRITAITEYPDEPERNTCTFANTVLTFAELAAKYEDTADTVSAVTTTGGQLAGSEIDELHANQIIDLENAVINYAYIQDLHTDYLEVAGKLTAAVAEIGELWANVGSFEEAFIQRLQADEADILKLKTTDLEAVNAKINTLETDYANIKSLLAGNAAATQADIIKLNADNAVIDSAMLKQALIGVLTVGDLMAGRISTNRFEIGSDDNSLLMTGSVLQMKDEDGNIRIQMGKDGQGAYSFSLFDRNGVAIWYQDGITRDGIPDGILVDSKIAAVSDTYSGIGLDKLNYSEIKGQIDTDGLKSSSIYFDESGQTLNQIYSQITQSITRVSGSAEQAQATARQALEEISGIDKLTSFQMSLSNDAHVVHTYIDGTGGDYSACRTTATLYLGETNVTDQAVYFVEASEGISGAWNEAEKTYQVTGMTADDGYVDITAVYGRNKAYLTDRHGNILTTRNGNPLSGRAGSVRLTKRFSVSKAPDGKTGARYEIRLSDQILTKNIKTGILTPPTLTVTAVMASGTSYNDYYGYFLIEESSDGVSYVTTYESPVFECSHVYAPRQNDTRTVRITLIDETKAKVLDVKSSIIIAPAEEVDEDVKQLFDSVQTLEQKQSTIESGVDGLRVDLQESKDELYLVAAGGAIGLQVPYSVSNGIATFTAEVYKDMKNITRLYPDSAYVWICVTEEGAEYLGTGYSISIPISKAGYGGVVRCEFTYDTDDIPASAA